MKVLLLIAMSLVSLNASADYFKAGVGYNLGGEVDTDFPAGSSSTDLDGTFMAPILLAYGFEVMGDVHGEIEVAYRQHEYDAAGATEEPTLLTGAFNFVGNLPMGGVTLTGGAGAFFGQFDSDSNDGEGSGFGLQLFAGLDFPLGNDVSLGGEFRYMTTVSDIGLDNNVDASYNNTAVIFNAKFGM